MFQPTFQLEGTKVWRECWEFRCYLIASRLDRYVWWDSLHESIAYLVCLKYKNVAKRFYDQLNFSDNLSCQMPPFSLPNAWSAISFEYLWDSNWVESICQRVLRFKAFHAIMYMVKLYTLIENSFVLIKILLSLYRVGWNVYRF